MVNSVSFGKLKIENVGTHKQTLDKAGKFMTYDGQNIFKDFLRNLDSVSGDEALYFSPYDFTGNTLKFQVLKQQPSNDIVVLSQSSVNLAPEIINTHPKYDRMRKQLDECVEGIRDALSPKQKFAQEIMDMYA